MRGERRLTLTTHAVTLFVPEGLREIGDGFRVWQWWRNGTPWGIGLLSAVALVLDGLVPTTNPPTYGVSRSCMVGGSSSCRSSEGGRSSTWPRTGTTSGAG